MPININGKLRIKGATTGGNGGGGGTEFISVWDTTLSKEPSIELPLVASGNYNFSVNWGDGNTDTITAWGQLERAHTYATDGVYTVTITGTIEGWSGVRYLTQIIDIGCLKLGNEGAYFQSSEELTSIGGTFDLTGTTNLTGMFNGCTLLTSVNGISSWNTSAVTDMSYMFINATAFNQPLNSWNTAAVTDMYSMFQNTTAFNQDISGWDVSSVTDMNYMFANATAFNQPLNSWNVSAVTDMTSMFSYSAFNQPLNSWDTSAVTNMPSMFEGTTAFNQDISGWDVSSVTDMNYMFGDTTAFNQSLNSWNTSAVTNMNSMFVYATAFNQPLNSWNVSAVTDMTDIFFNATNFNQNISGWDVSNVQYMNRFMDGKSTADFSYYDDLLNAWSLLTLQNGVYWDMGSIEYTSAGATARQDIIDNYSWNITDGGLAA